MTHNDYGVRLCCPLSDPTAIAPFTVPTAEMIVTAATHLAHESSTRHVRSLVVSRPACYARPQQHAVPARRKPL